MRAEHLGSMTRPPTSGVAVVISAGFVLVSLVVIVGSWAAYFTDSRIHQYGSRAEGVVTKTELIRSADGDSDHSINYSFALPTGKTISARHRVPKEAWTKLRPGSQVTVSYSAENPSRNFPSGMGVTSIFAPVLASAVFGALAFIGGLVLYRIYRQRMTPAD